MTGADPRLQVARLVRMLGSDFSAEVAAAGRLADQMLKRAGLTWGDVVALPRPVPRSLSLPELCATALASGGLTE